MNYPVNHLPSPAPSFAELSGRWHACQNVPAEVEETGQQRLACFFPVTLVKGAAGKGTEENYSEIQKVFNLEMAGEEECQSPPLWAKGSRRDFKWHTHGVKIFI